MRACMRDSAREHMVRMPAHIGVARSQKRIALQDHTAAVRVPPPLTRRGHPVRTDMGIDRHMYGHVYGHGIDMCLDMCMGIGMCMRTCMSMYVDMRIGMCVGMCMDHVYRHVYRKAHKHAYRRD